MSSRRRRAACPPGDLPLPAQPVDPRKPADQPQEAPRAHRRQAASLLASAPDMPLPEARPARRRRPSSPPPEGALGSSIGQRQAKRRRLPPPLPEDAPGSFSIEQRLTSRRRLPSPPPKDAPGSFSIGQRLTSRRRLPSPPPEDALGSFSIGQRQAKRRRLPPPPPEDALGSFSIGQRPAKRRMLPPPPPEDALGSFSLHTRSRRKGRLSLHRIALVLLGMTAAFSLMMITSILWRSVRTRRLNAELSRRRAQLTQAEASASPEGITPSSIQPSSGQPSPDQPSPDQPSPGQPSPTPTASSEASAPSAGFLMLSDAADTDSLPEQTEALAPVVSSTVYHRVGGTALPHMEALYEDNHDLIGWISIPQVLDLPVMYKDNTYYLTHDFDRQRNTSGCIFLDERHRFGEHTQNLLLHGHNMKDGAMFGRLVHYAQDIDFFKRNAFVDYDTLWERDQYVMFAVLRVSLDVHDERFFNYFSYPSFDSDEAFDRYVREVQLRSMYAVPLDVSPSDALLTLSTCIDDDRLVIVCRRVREGESHSQLERTIRLSVRQ
ncbi:MAG: sortase domain-bontaining protein [Candidatus Ventricola sp.]